MHYTVDMRFTLMVLPLVLAAASLPNDAIAGMGPPPIITASAFADAPIGQTVELLVKVDSFNRTTLHGHIGEHGDGMTYRLTKNAVTLFVPSDLQVVMGTMADVKPNAAVFVSAVKTAPNRADVKNLVVATPYVHF